MSRRSPILIALLCFALLSALLNHARAEPQPPDLLEIVVVESTAGETTIDVTMKPNAMGDVELTLPPQARSMDKSKSAGRKRVMHRGGARHTERLRCSSPPASVGQPIRLSFRAVLRNDAGEVIVDLTKVVRLGTESPASPSLENERVPVVFTTPDGSKRVEYMTRADANRRGLTPAQPVRPPAGAEDPSAGCCVDRSNCGHDGPPNPHLLKPVKK